MHRWTIEAEGGWNTEEAAKIIDSYSYDRRTWLVYTDHKDHIPGRRLKKAFSSQQGVEYICIERVGIESIPCCQQLGRYVDELRMARRTVLPNKVCLTSAPRWVYGTYTRLITHDWTFTGKIILLQWTMVESQFSVEPYPGPYKSPLQMSWREIINLNILLAPYRKCWIALTY